jgi:antitoxin HicB
MASVSGYRIEIQALSKADGGRFVGIAIDLPGCMSEGETQEGAIKNLRDAIAEWIKQARAAGRSVPEPIFYVRGLELRTASRH